MNFIYSLCKKNLVILSSKNMQKVSGGLFSNHKNSKSMLNLHVGTVKGRECYQNAGQHGMQGPVRGMKTNFSH